MRQVITIFTETPTLNEMFSVERIKRSSMKSKCENKVLREILRKGLKPVRGQCKITFHVNTYKRADLDNIASVFIKVFLDALQRAGVLPDDNKDYVTALEVTYHKANQHYVTVVIDEKEKDLVIH